MAVICLTFGANLQKAEQHLMLYNKELRQQALTDPLTTLYNRRKMEEILNNHMAANPDGNFCIAIGDIDSRKRRWESVMSAAGEAKNFSSSFLTPISMMPTH